MRWAIITGEYPPQTGGVSDYTRLLARRLADMGDEVHVWAPECSLPELDDLGVEVHRLPGCYGFQAIATLHRTLEGLRPYQLLVQYGPHMYGFKAMNLLLCAWLFLRRKDAFWAMFHEVAFPISKSNPLRHNLLGLMQRLMGRIVAASADHSFASIPNYQAMLQSMAPRRRVDWLPVPSNCSTVPDQATVRKLRSQVLHTHAASIIGHFGRFGPETAPLLAKILPPLLLKDNRRIAWLVGPGGDRFAAALTERWPKLRGRFHCTGNIAPEDVATHLAVADLLVQPYSTGASSKRGTLMAGLAVGLPIVATAGPQTEALWEEHAAVRLAPTEPLDRFWDLCEQLIQSPEQRMELGQRAASLYACRFAIEHTVAQLRSRHYGTEGRKLADAPSRATLENPS